MSTIATDDRQRVRAQAKWVRTSARKARLVLDHIRSGDRQAQVKRRT